MAPPISAPAPTMISTPRIITSASRPRWLAGEAGTSLVMAESSVNGELRELHAGDMHKGWRLDHFLAKALPELSRARLQTLIKEGRVRKGEATIGDPNFRVKPGESYAVRVPPPIP